MCNTYNYTLYNIIFNARLKDKNCSQLTYIRKKIPVYLNHTGSENCLLFLSLGKIYKDCDL